MNDTGYIAEESEMNRTPDFSNVNLVTEQSDPHF